MASYHTSAMYFEQSSQGSVRSCRDDKEKEIVSGIINLMSVNCFALRIFTELWQLIHNVGNYATQIP